MRGEKAKFRSDETWRRVEPFEEADAARVRYLTSPKQSGS